MKVIKQSSASENAVAALSNLVQVLQINVTKSSLLELRNHPEYPSLSSISYSLANWGVESLAMNASLSQLEEIPYPAIAHLHKRNGHFVVLKKLYQNQLIYIDPEIGEIEEPLLEFEKKWSGVVLLVESNAKSGEEDYATKRKSEVFEEASQYISLALIVVGLLAALVYTPSVLLPLFLLKIIGSVFCFVLLQKQFGLAGDSINAFCKMGTKTDCDSVIHSPASKLFSMIHLSELGVWYFVGGLLVLIASLIAETPTGLLLPLSLSALPLSFYTIYYQWQVIKKWCPLCVGVMVIIWLECLVGLTQVSGLQVSWPGSIIVFVSFSLPLIFWLSVRNRFMESFRVSRLVKNLSRFTKSERVFQGLLANQPFTKIVDFENDTHLGNVEAPIEIAIVSNPTCGPCRQAHKILESLPEVFENKVKIKYRFMVSPFDSTSLSYQMLKHLFSFKLIGNEPEFHRALSNWFLSTGTTDIEKWKAHSFKGEFDDTIVHETINQHYQWCKDAGITVTPTIFINGRQLPEEFLVTDLKFQIRRMVEQLPVIEPEPVS